MMVRHSANKLRRRTVSSRAGARRAFPFAGLGALRLFGAASPGLAWLAQAGWLEGACLRRDACTRG
jgi:hypothetical protein